MEFEEQRHAREAARIRRGDAAEIGAYEAGLRREMREAHPSEDAGELGEDRQVSVQPDPLDAPDADR